MKVNKDYKNPDIVKSLKQITKKVLYTRYPTYIQSLKDDINYITGVAYLNTLDNYDETKGSFSTRYYYEVMAVLHNEYISPSVAEKRNPSGYLQSLEIDDLTYTNEYHNTEDIFKIVRQVIDNELKEFRRKTDVDISQIFIDHYYYGYSITEIADKLNVSRQRIYQYINSTIMLIKKYKIKEKIW